MKDILSAEEAAELCGCSVDTINDCAASGDLPATKIGRSYIFPREVLIKRLNEKAFTAAMEIRRVADDVAAKLRGGKVAPQPAVHQRLQDLLQQRKIAGAMPFSSTRQLPPDLDAILKGVEPGAVIWDEAELTPGAGKLGLRP